jgi:murein L,D-transpeptidase YafK
MKSILSIPCILFLLTACIQSQDSLKNYTYKLDDLLDSLSISGGNLHLVIDKSDYILSVKNDTFTVKQYPVVFGGNPVDDKLRQGDRCTPEGNFKVITKYPHRSWDKFIWIDYPTDDSWRKHRKAKQEGILSDSDGIGGEIGIHGVPGGTDYMIDTRLNWTLGCISLKNDDINDFYPFVRKGTIVVINK